MTADPHTRNSAPRKPLYAPLAASTPLAGASRRSEPSYGPLRAVQRLAVDSGAVWSDSCAADPEPPPGDGDDGPWCKWPTDLSGQRATTDALDTMTTLPVKGDLL